MIKNALEDPMGGYSAPLPRPLTGLRDNGRGIREERDEGPPAARYYSTTELALVLEEEGGGGKGEWEREKDG